MVGYQTSELAGFRTVLENAGHLSQIYFSPLFFKASAKGLSNDGFVLFPFFFLGFGL
jgi:hypothetical protein